MNWQEMENRGIDYDLRVCLEYNPQGGYAVNNIEKVFAVWEGENEEDDWRWVFSLKNGAIVFLRGGCGYTGWDWASWAQSTLLRLPGNFASFDITKAINDDAELDSAEVRAELARQIEEGKHDTWHQQTAKELGVESMPIVTLPNTKKGEE